MKNYKLYNVGDVVEIIHSHSSDKGKIGTIVEVRPSFCKIEIEGYNKPLNHTYGQFKKLEGDESQTNYKHYTDIPQMRKLKTLTMDIFVGVQAIPCKVVIYNNRTIRIRPKKGYHTSYGLAQSVIAKMREFTGFKGPSKKEYNGTGEFYDELLLGSHEYFYKITKADENG